MPSPFIRFLFTLTSLAPACLVYAAVFTFDKDPILTWNRARALALVSLGLMTLLVVLCLSVLRFYSKKLKQRSLDICSLKPADKPAIGFVVAYLLPVVFGRTFVAPWEVVLVVFGLLAWLVYVSDTHLVNPLLRLFGYRFYEVTTEDQITYTLVSRTKIVNTDNPIDVRVGSDFMVLKVER